MAVADASQIAPDARTVDVPWKNIRCSLWLQKIYGEPMIKYTDQELLHMLEDLESDRVERKESFSGDVSKKAREAICAFANDLPNHNAAGVLFIGVRDNGEPAGISVTDQLLLTVASMKTDGRIMPFPAYSVEKRVLKGAEIIVVTVMPSDMPPVKYEGRIWVRTGPRKSIANEQEERILSEKRRCKNIPFDIFPVPSATLQDISKVLFENEFLPNAFAPDVLEANGRTYEERLAACKMTASPDNPTPTVLGLLAVGKSPQDFLPGAYIQFLRLKGTELADPVSDEEKIGGALSDVLRRINDKCKMHNLVGIDAVTSEIHSTSITYPPAALQQIVYNAVLHRTYESTNAPVRVYWFDDRVEIHSPGGPYGNVTPENFGLPGITDYRNPNIATALKIFGFVQSFGRGIAIAREEMKKNGNSEPEFNVTRNAIVCTLRGKR